MKKSIGLIVVLCILLCTLTVAANEPPHSDITWNVENGILTIKGQGAMEDYKTEASIPWYEKRSEIKEIIVEDGITHIGNMAFYGLKNANKATIANTVESVGICAFHYTEGTRTSLGNLNADFQFNLESDSSVVSKGDTFTLTVTVNGDFKNVSSVQTAIVFDKNIISIDSKTCMDEEWLNTVDENNLGYISSPLAGNVANNLRIAYISLSGTYIDEEAPLYSAGKTDVVIAKVHCKALEDIKDLNTGILMLKNSNVAYLTEGKALSASVGENQLTACTRLPISGLKIITGSKVVADHALSNSITVENAVSEDLSGKSAEDIKVYVQGEEIDLYTNPFINDDGTIMIPLRAVMEKMGIAVIWDGETNTIFMANDESFAATQLGKTLLFRNEESVEISKASVAQDHRTLVPIDFFAKSFGFETNWDKDTWVATIK